LRELGVHNSSVFLTNATIWVEGITDRLYLKTYMKKYAKDNIEYEHLQEDIHYSFVEYQGSNLVHWDFSSEDSDTERIRACFLCGNPFLLADRDIISKGNRKRVFQDMLGEDRFEVLKCKEIENLVPEEVVRTLVRGKLADCDTGLSVIKYEEYSTSEEGLGKYLDEKLALPNGDAVFASTTGTIKNKVGFCRRACELMNEDQVQWSLTTPIRELCEKIFSFISKQDQ
ncbi:unnamed protein product, partial [marine sediment metagenome]